MIVRKVYEGHWCVHCDVGLISAINRGRRACALGRIESHIRFMDHDANGSCHDIE